MATDNIFYSKDGGKQWRSPDMPTRGYRECVEFIGRNTLIALGPGGMDISLNNGRGWFPFSDEKNFHTLRKARNGKLVIAAGKGKIAIISKGAGN